MIITVWERQCGESFLHNHISVGYDPWARYPVGKTRQQTKEWRGAHWQKKEARLIAGKVTFVASTK